MENIRLNLEKYRGKWYARGVDVDGKHVRKSLGLNDSVSKHAALKSLGAMEAMIRSNGGRINSKVGKTTMRELIDLYVERGIKNGEKSKVKAVETRWGLTPVTEITEAAMLNWEREMLNKGLNPSSVKRYGTSLKAIVNYGCKAAGMAKLNLPVIGTESPPRVLVIENDDRDMIMAEMTEDVRWFYTVLSFTGARPVELIRLTWKDVNLQKSRMTVRSYKGKNGSEMERTIPYSSKVGGALEALRERFGGSRDDYVFKLNNGIAFADFSDSASAIRTRLYRAAEKAGFGIGVKNGITPYAFRHSFGTNAGENRLVNPMVLSDYLGHKNVQTTKDNYFHGGVGDAEILVQGLG